MKIFMTTVWALAVALSASSQEALWQGPQIVSPQVNADTTVTFRIYAPEARNVQISGDFLTPGRHVTAKGDTVQTAGVMELKRGDDGLWTYTSTQLAPELYTYHYIVDGMRVDDPSNVYRMRDVSTVSDFFIVPGGRADLYTVRDVPHGALTRLWYKSPTAGTDRRMTVYTPAGYFTGNTAYPVLYLLHGMGGDEEAWPALGRVAPILDNLIAEGRAVPMIVVMTNGNISQKGAPGEAADGMAQPSFDMPRTMNGEFEKSFPDVVKFMDSNFRTIPDKAHRAIAGLSMGGFHACVISATYPDAFDYVGLFSAAVRPEKFSQSEFYNGFDNKLTAQFAHRPRLYWIGIGRDDFLYDANKEYRKQLDSRGYPYEYMETYGGHTWRNWRVYLTEFAQKLFKD